jgi:hypothetical protein
MAIGRSGRKDPKQWVRRDFLAAGSLTVLSGTVSKPLSGAAALLLSRPATQGRLLRAQIGEAIRYPGCTGDVWTTTWADDDNLYSVTDDTTGFDHACNSNLALQKIMGGPPPHIHGVTVNPMSSFGKAGALEEDGASWKASGLTCVDGALYLSVSRHKYANARGYSYWIQETWDSSLIKSTDHAKTWSAMPQLNHAMFPGRIFSNPFYVQYGKNGEGSKDGADTYVYAVSNDGAWNNGNWMTMGRVRRDRICKLDPGDWEFIHGYDNNRRPIWGPRVDNGLYVFRAPGRASMTGIHFIQSLDLYIMPLWYYPYAQDPKRRWTVTRWELYRSPAPWGPWARFHTQDFEPQSFYNPSIPSKFISEDGRKLWIFAAGDFTDRTAKYYGLNMIPVNLASD